jgi:hypothetical protein
VFVIDEDCVGVKEESIIMDGNVMNAVEENIITDGSLMNAADCKTAHTERSYSTEQWQTGDGKKALNTCCEEVRELLSKIRSVTYLTNSVTDMQEAKVTLNGLYNKLRATCRTVEGLMLEEDSKFKCGPPDRRQNFKLRNLPTRKRVTSKQFVTLFLYVKLRLRSKLTCFKKTIFLHDNENE